MRVHRLTAFQVPIALRKTVRHASHERSANETLIVRCVLDDGSCGWGEGLPRPYVTGESIDSVWRHLKQSNFSSLRETTFSSALEISRTIDNFQLADVARIRVSMSESVSETPSDVRWNWQFLMPPAVRKKSALGISSGRTPQSSILHNRGRKFFTVEL